MQEVKPMYPQHIIFARTISIEPSLRRSFRENSRIHSRSFSRHATGFNLSMTRTTWAIHFCRFFVINAAFLFEPPMAILGLANPLQSTDQGIATWFHDRLTPAFATLLHTLTEFGSRKSIGILSLCWYYFSSGNRGGHLS